MLRRNVVFVNPQLRGANMKLKNKLILATTIGFSLSAYARQVNVDFAPLSRWNDASGVSEPLSANGLALGWYLKGDAKVDGQPLDYKKVQTDEEYARKASDQNDKLFDEQAWNVLYDVKTGKSLSEVPKPKDADGKEIAYASCFEGAAFGSNHRDCDLDYEPATETVVAFVNFKWQTGSIQAIRVENGQAKAWGNLTEKVKTIFQKELDKRFKEDRQYKADREKLAFNFLIRGMDRGANDNTSLISGTGNASVPKEDGFDANVKGVVKLVRTGDAIDVKSTVAK